MSGGPSIQLLKDNKVSCGGPQVGQNGMGNICKRASSSLILIGISGIPISVMGPRLLLHQRNMWLRTINCLQTGGQGMYSYT